MTEQPDDRAAHSRKNLTRIPVEDASRRYSGKWILMEVTEFDEHRIPKGGFVRLASKSRHRITAEALRLKEAGTGSTSIYYVFHSTPTELSPLDMAINAADSVIAKRGKRAGPRG